MSNENYTENLAVIIPTLRGREIALANAVTSLSNAPLGAIYIIEGKDTCGEAWNIGISLALFQNEATHVLLFADDLYPANTQWWEAGKACLDDNEIPAPILLEEGSNARWNDGDGAPGTPYAFSRVPLLTKEMARNLYPMPNLHYYSDCWVGSKLNSLGVNCRIIEGYSFYHSWASPGRKNDSEIDRQLYEAETGKL